MGNHEPKLCLVADQPICLSNKFNNFIVNQDDFNKCVWSAFDSIYILAELTWDGKTRSEFYGIELVKKLRLRNVDIPVVICSFMPRKVLIEKYRHEILGFRGHGFIHLPDEVPVSNEDFVILSPLEMLDVQSHFCGLSGAISSIYHQKQKAGNDPESARPFLIKMLLEIQSLPGLPFSIKEKLTEDINIVANINDRVKLENFLKLPVTHLTSLLQTEQDYKDKGSQGSLQKKIINLNNNSINRINNNSINLSNNNLSNNNNNNNNQRKK